MSFLDDTRETAAPGATVRVPTWPGLAGVLAGVCSLITAFLADRVVPLLVLGYVLGAVVVPALAVLHRYYAEARRKDPWFVGSPRSGAVITTAVVLGVTFGTGQCVATRHRTGEEVISRLWTAALALGAIVSTPVLLANPAQADESRGFSDMAGCISHANHLLVAMVVDESASLQQTDPEAKRVEGIQAAIDSLEQLRELSPDLDVEVALSTFARGYEQVVPWRPLTPRTADQLRKAAATHLPGRDTGDATDYRQALQGSQRQLDSQASALKDPSACKATLLFTDGALDVDAQTALAETQICQPGGIIDSVRHDNIAVIALALFTPGAGVTPQQRDLLRAIAEGQGETTTCGTVPIAPGDSQGVYLPATDPAALQFLFARTGAQVAGGSPDNQVTCPSSACPHGLYTLRVDPGVVGARVIIRTAGALQLQSPSGQIVSLTSDPQDVDGTQITTLRRGALSTINFAFQGMTTTATSWSITTNGPATIQTYWFWGATVRQITHSVRAGAPNNVQLQLVDVDGNPVSPTTYATLNPSIVIDGRPAHATVSQTGLITAHFPLGVADPPSSVLLSATLTARTQPSGHALGPVHLSGDLDVALPPAFPQVSPNSLDFGAVTGTGSRTAQITISGSSLGPTRACLQSSSIAFPGSAHGVDRVSAHPSCVDVPKNGHQALALTLTPKTSADGVARGSVVLALRASDGRSVHTALPASLEMSRAVDQGKRWEIVALLLVAAVLIPLLMLLGSNYWLLGRFPSRPAREQPDDPSS